jgi:hypothetical protein
MSSLEKPFVGYCCKKHMKDVVMAGERPKMDGSHVSLWPVDLQWIMKSAWSSDPDARPTFGVIVDILQKVLLELKDPKLDRIRARSEGSALSVTETSTGTIDSSSPTRIPIPKGRPLLKIPRLVSRS